jgi:hypothetical protein
MSFISDHLFQVKTLLPTALKNGKVKKALNAPGMVPLQTEV